MTLPKAISDAIDDYQVALWTSDCEDGKNERAALERAIADHVSPVEPWPNEHGTHDVKLHYDGSRSVDGVTFTLTDRKTGVVTRYVPEQAAATPAPSALERLRERVRDWPEGRSIPRPEVIDWIDEEREREAKR